jgi:hypothetical protein
MASGRPNSRFVKPGLAAAKALIMRNAAGFHRANADLAVILFVGQNRASTSRAMGRLHISESPNGK